MDPTHAFASRAAHAGRAPTTEPRSRPLLPPIHQTTVYAFESLDDLDAVYGGASGGIYYRNGSPTHAALEAAIASLEGAEAAVTAASGMAIATAAALALACAGDRVIGDTQAYGGTYTLLTAELPRLGIAPVLVDATDLDAVDRALAAGASALLVEALSNPTVRVMDIPALCALGRTHGVPVLVDATFASPALIRPVEHGAALAWHSLAKYIGGHSAAAGGCGAGEQWLVAAIREKIIHMGAVQGAMDAWLTLLGIPTLPLRIAAHTRTASAVARYLEGQPAVSAVHFPGLSSHPQHALAARIYPDGSGGMLAFDLRGGEAAARRFLASLRLIAFAPSLADVTTTVSYPLATSHRGLPATALAAAGVTPGLIRLSAGIEDPADVIADLERALAALD